MRLKPGGNRELHWRGIAAEWTFVITEKPRTTVVNPNGEYHPSPLHEPGSPARTLRYGRLRANSP
ncbi:MAG TPA: hypothetical protein VOA41_08160 [Candidatus Dormibacteraeota bacterium]|nr:hypothetical protein [Candidatus Dormibacteraeota bacterium]